MKERSEERIISAAKTERKEVAKRAVSNDSLGVSVAPLLVESLCLFLLCVSLLLLRGLGSIMCVVSLVSLCDSLGRLCDSVWQQSRG